MAESGILVGALEGETYADVVEEVDDLRTRVRAAQDLHQALPASHQTGM